MKILALDPATKTGWAHTCGKSGVWDFSLKKDETVGVKFLKLRKQLTEIFLAEGIDLVVMEVPRGFGHHNALVSHSKFCGAIEDFCAENGIQHKGYSATKIKKSATGKGNANKKKMVSLAHKEFPNITIEDDNHADALWLLELAKKEFE
jgi:Holliday junction resolvasome RuvABC endonuclease subunit